jgi:hypothetical protein
MVIERTVEIHDDRRLTLNLPEETPTGRAKAAVTLVFEIPGRLKSRMRSRIAPVL